MQRKMSNKNKRIYRRRYAIAISARIIFCVVMVFVAVIFGITAIKVSKAVKEEIAVSKARDTTVPEWIDKQIIDVGKGGREGKELKRVKNIVIHYVGNPSTTAQNNYDYFNKESTKVSSHFLIGLEGEIIQCIPINEESAASNWRNDDTISIEVCHPDESGKFNEATYDSLVKLTSWLCYALYLDEDDVIRHYDITGKMCPIYFVENENEWKTFKKRVGISLFEYF